MKAKDKLRADWSKKSLDLVFHWPYGTSTICDACWLSGVFSREFTDELRSDAAATEAEPEITHGRWRGLGWLCFGTALLGDLRCSVRRHLRSTRICLEVSRVGVEITHDYLVDQKTDRQVSRVR